MRFHIECRFKSLTQPQPWKCVSGNGQPHTFNEEEVRMFKADLSPDDFDYGMEYRVRVHDDDVDMAQCMHIQPINAINPPLGLFNDDDQPGPGPHNFVKQFMNRLFVTQGA